MPLAPTPLVRVAAALLRTTTSPFAADRDRLLAVVFNGVPTAPILPPVDVRLNVLVVNDVDEAPVMLEPAFIVMLVGAFTEPVNDTVVPALAIKLLAELKLPVSERAPVLFAPAFVVSRLIVFIVPDPAVMFPDTARFCPWVERLNCLPLPATPAVSVAAPLFNTTTSPLAAESAKFVAEVFNAVPTAPMFPPIDVRLRVAVVNEVDVAAVMLDPALIVMLVGALTAPVRDTVVPARAIRLAADVSVLESDRAPVLFAPAFVVSRLIVFIVPDPAVIFPLTVRFCP